MLRQPGPRRHTPVTRLRYVAAATGGLASVEVPRLLGSGGQVGRNFGGVVTISDGPVLVWGPPERFPGPGIGWAAELVPPMFDDGAWQEVETFDRRLLPFSALTSDAMRFKLRHGEVSLTYDADKELLLFRDAAHDTGWVAQPTMDVWLQERDWYEFLVGEPVESLIEIMPGSRDAQRFDPDPALPDGWAEAYMDRLSGEPTLRIAHLDPERRTDPLLAAMLPTEARLGGFGVRGEVHASAGCDSAWVIGLDNGYIVAHDPEGGRFKAIAEVFGIPTEMTMSERDGTQQLRVEYWPTLGRSESPRRAVFESRRGPDGIGWAEVSDEAIEDGRPYVWTDRRVARLQPWPGGGASVEWNDLATLDWYQTIDRTDGLDLVGLLDMPDGRVVGYGTDRQRGNDAPVLVDVVRGRRGILWHRDFGFYAHNVAMPTQSITRAVYIPEARRVLMVAGETVWSTNRWFSDWRDEGPVPQADEGEDD